MRRYHFTETATLVVFLAVYGSLTLLTWSLFLRHPAETTFPLFSVHGLYTDLLLYRGKMLHLDSGAVGIGHGLPAFNYLAPAAFLYSWLLHASDPVSTFVRLVGFAFTLLLLGAGVLLYRRRLLRPLHVLTLLALLGSYPMLFLLARANLEGIVWIFVTAFLVLFLSGRPLPAAVMLGLAMSIKPFPAILLLLLLRQRKWLCAAVSPAIAITANLLALHRLGPTIAAAYRDLKPGVALYLDIYIQHFLNISELAFCHSVLDCLKVLYLFGGASEHLSAGVDVPFGNAAMQVPAAMLVVAAAITLLTFGLVLWRLVRMPVGNQVCGCCIALTLLLPSAADYTLCSLYVPLLLIGYNVSVQTRLKGELWTGRQMLFLTVPCAVCMAPLRCFHSWMGPVHTLVLYCLLFGVVTIPLYYGADRVMQKCRVTGR